VPEELKQLENLHCVLLHANELSGSVFLEKKFNEDIFIADCGFPSSLFNPSLVRIAQCAAMEKEVVRKTSTICCGEDFGLYL